MELCKKIIKRLLFPPTAIMILLIPISVCMLVYAFVYAGTTAVISYISYALSAYTLTVVCIKIPHLIRFAKTLKQENRYISLWANDAQLRVKLSLYGSLLYNTAYALFQVGLGLYHGSIWFYSLAAYYFLLAVMRFFLLRDVRSFNPGANRNRDSELRRYRFCGVVLLVMNLALALMVFYISFWNRGFAHHQITTIAMAAYTFTAMTVAIVNVVKYRKYDSPVLSAAKAISLATAAVSMLTLETSMLTAFGDETVEAYRALLTALTGSAVCVFVLVMAVYMIVHANKELSASQQRSNDDGRE